MGIAWVLLILLPFAFLPDIAGSDQDDDEASDDAEAPQNSASLLTPASFGPAPDDHTPIDILDPIYDDDIADDGTQNPDPDLIVEPTIEDDSPTPPDSEEGDVLAPIVEDDLKMGSVMPPSEPALALGPEEIENFEVGQDILYISVDETDDEKPLEIKVKPSNHGQDSLVFVDKHLVAVLKDAPNANAQDVVIEIENQANRSHGSGARA